MDLTIIVSKFYTTWADEFRDLVGKIVHLSPDITPLLRL